MIDPRSGAAAPKNRRRSKLVTLALSRRDMERAARSGADIIQINMEDGVPLERKAEAREILLRALDEIDWNGAERWIKINPLKSGEAERDVEVLSPARPDAFILAKLQGPEDALAYAEMISAAESGGGLPAGGIRLVACIERIRALSQVEDIACCHPRMTALQFGPTDMSYEYGYRLDRTGPSFETLYARSRCVLAARLAGIDSGDAPYWFHQDHLGTLRSALWTFQLGFTHKACHAPEQVPIVHKAYDMVADPNEDWAARYMREAHEDL